MAKAIVVTEPVVPVVPKRTVHLELTEWEARVLVNLCESVGGRHSGPRGKTNGIKEALQLAGIKYVELDKEGAVYFNGEEKE